MDEQGGPHRQSDSGTRTVLPLNVFLDGLTLNRSLDLICEGDEAPQRLASRRAAPVAYYRSLGDLVTSAVFASSISFDSKVQERERAQEFVETLTEASGDVNLAMPLEPRDGAEPHTLLISGDQEYGAALRRAIEGLDKAWALDAPCFRVWRPWIIRDAVYYIHPNATLLNPNLTPCEYVFDPERDFFVNPQSEPVVRRYLAMIESQAYAFSKAVEFLSAGSAGFPPCCDEARKEFARRVLFTHLLIMVYFMFCFDVRVRLIAPRQPTYYMSDLVLGPTRQLVVRSEGGHRRPEAEILDAVLPDATADLLLRTRKALGRGQQPVKAVCAAIVEMRGLKSSKYLRDLLCKYRMSRGADHEDEIRQHVSDLIEARRYYRWGSDTVRVGISGPTVPLSIVPDVLGYVRHRLTKRGRWALSVVRGKSKGDRERMSSLLADCFPLTFGGLDGSAFDGIV